MPQKKNRADRGHIMTLVSHLSHMSHSHMCDLNEHAEDWWVSIHHVTPYLLCVIVYPGAMQESSKPNCHVFCCIDTPYVIINVCKYHQIPTKHPQASINICVTSKVPSILKRFQHFWASPGLEQEAAWDSVTLCTVFRAEFSHLFSARGRFPFQLGKERKFLWRTNFCILSILFLAQEHMRPQHSMSMRNGDRDLTVI